MTDKKTSKEAEHEALLNLRRAYTTGGKLGARQMFIFNEDGTIQGLKKVEPQQAKQGEGSPKSKRKSQDLTAGKKFGRLSSQQSISAMSMGGETNVAFSDANYMPQEG